MPRIKQVRKYTIPVYPRGAYYVKPDPAIVAAGKGAFATAVMMLLLEACDGGGTTGPPPLPPEYVTETEARAAIMQVFADNGVSLTQDLMLRFEQAPGDSVDLELDGYNDSLGVGYEYIFEDDYSVFTPEVVGVIDSVASDNGPYIKTVDQIEKQGDYEAYLDSLMQEFIDTLKANGVI